MIHHFRIVLFIFCLYILFYIPNRFVFISLSSFRCIRNIIVFLFLLFIAFLIIYFTESFFPFPLNISQIFQSFPQISQDRKIELHLFSETQINQTIRQQKKMKKEEKEKRRAERGGRNSKGNRFFIFVQFKEKKKEGEGKKERNCSHFFLLISTVLRIHEYALQVNLHSRKQS